jgi:RimJ/RimL family protein N-acetyltransferase
VEAVIGWASDRGATSLYLGVTETNHPAIALYERCGFRPTGTRRPLEHTPALTVLEMVREM